MARRRPLRWIDVKHDGRGRHRLTEVMAAAVGGVVARVEAAQDLVATAGDIAILLKIMTAGVYGPLTYGALFQSVTQELVPFWQLLLIFVISVGAGFGLFGYLRGVAKKQPERFYLVPAVVTRTSGKNLS